MVVDKSPLARNMYQILFSGQNRFDINYSEEFDSLFKKSARLKPDLLIINSNALDRGKELKFPCPTIIIASKDRIDLKESAPHAKGLYLLEKPFYPYDLLSVANRLVQDKRESPARGRPPGRGGQKK
jgi:DNA-binding NtrC family response regulator